MVAPADPAVVDAVVAGSRERALVWVGVELGLEVGLVGDGKAIMAQLNAVLRAHSWSYPTDTPWRQSIAAKIEGSRT